jgi:hypothetical protein
MAEQASVFYELAARDKRDGSLRLFFGLSSPFLFGKKESSCVFCNFVQYKPMYGLI